MDECQSGIARGWATVREQGRASVTRGVYKVWGHRAGPGKRQKGEPFKDVAK